MKALSNNRYYNIVFIIALWIYFTIFVTSAFPQQINVASNILSPTVTEGEFYVRTEDVIYGRKFGMALTLDILSPKKAKNGIGIIGVISGGYFSSHEAIRPAAFRPLLENGYTVFAVVHGSQPRFTVPEAFQDVKRAVRFVRYHAKTFGVNPDKIGATGASAGGNLSLLLGIAADEGNSASNDPIEKMSAKVQAVACFYPPTDFLNWEAEGKARIRLLDYENPFRPAFDYRELNKELNIWERVTNETRLAEITRGISPIYFVDEKDAPTLIIHGNQDKLVPLRQSETLINKLKSAGVPAKLIIKEGAGHGWINQTKDMEAFVEWFDTYLLNKKK